MIDSSIDQIRYNECSHEHSQEHSECHMILPIHIQNTLMNFLPIRSLDLEDDESDDTSVEEILQLLPSKRKKKSGRR